MTRIKYPRIPHIRGSHLIDPDDYYLKYSILGRHFIVTEKVDGSQIAFTSDKNDVIHAYNRNTELLLGHSDKQFDELQLWINKRYNKLLKILDSAYILYGEWLYHTHTVYYDKLPDWFIGFGIKDKNLDQFLPVTQAKDIIESIGLEFVPIIYSGQIHEMNQLAQWIKKSNYSSTEQMEGLVFHSPAGVTRCKYVTSEFKESVDRSRHWRQCDRTKNKLAKWHVFK